MEGSKDRDKGRQEKAIMKILVINSGSSSLKFQVIDSGAERDRRRLYV